jgi:hypothetical protein
MYIGASGGAKTGRLPDQHPAVQVGDTLHRSESPISHGFQRFDPSFNRTAVIFNINFHGDMPSEARIFRVSFCLIET